MASNGYVRKECSSCIFYNDAKEYGHRCSLKGEVFDSEQMKYVSASDCERDPYLNKKYHADCAHYTHMKAVKNQIREKYGIIRIEYS